MVTSQSVRSNSITAAWFDPAAAMWRPIQSTNAGVAEWFRPNSIDERLPRMIENAIDKSLGLLHALFMGCLIESPCIKIIHGGVLAMRGCFLAKLTFAKDAAFSNTNLAPRQVRICPPRKPPDLPPHRDYTPLRRQRRRADGPLRRL